MKTIVHIGPALHGIAAYDEQIDAIYRQQGYVVEPVLVATNADVQAETERVTKLLQRPGSIGHFEIGAGDHTVWRISRRILKQNPKPQLVTIHDPGVVLNHPIPVPGAQHANTAVALPAKAVRKAVNRTLGRALVSRYLADPRIHRSYLRPDLAADLGGAYIPQPTYHPELPAAPKPATQPWRIGFGGYWGLGKGLETLLEAAGQLRREGRQDFRLVIGGGTSGADNRYAQDLRTETLRVDPEAELPGFVPDEQLDSFLQSLAVLVLPYWPELPNGTSAMAMRAAELGVPIIASDTRALNGQLGPEGAAYVKPKDTAALQSALATFLDNPQAAAKRARATQQHIFAEHNWAVVGRALQTYVESARDAA